MIYDKYRNASRSVAGFIAACLIWNIAGIFALPPGKPEQSDGIRPVRPEQATEKPKANQRRPPAPAEEEQPGTGPQQSS